MLVQVLFRYSLIALGKYKKMAAIVSSDSEISAIENINFKDLNSTLELNISLLSDI